MTAPREPASAAPPHHSVAGLNALHAGRCLASAATRFDWMCTTAHTHFDTILHSGEWPAIKAKLAETNPFANLPYVLDGETVVSQSNACLVYLAGRFGALHPPSPLTVLICLRLKPK